jgi:hypothetical protein
MQIVSCFYVPVQELEFDSEMWRWDDHVELMQYTAKLRKEDIQT